MRPSLHLVLQLILLLLLTSSCVSGAVQSSSPEIAVASRTETPFPVDTPNVELIFLPSITNSAAIVTPVPTAMSFTVEDALPTPMTEGTRVADIPTATGSPVTTAPVCEGWPKTPAAQPDAAYVVDVTLVDGSQTNLNESFVKTWRMRNTGGCTWPVGTVLNFVTGYPLPGTGAVPVPLAAPGEDVDVSIALTAPPRPGLYESYWRLQTREGYPFGSVVFLKLAVKDLGDAIQVQASTTPTVPFSFSVPGAPSPAATPTLIPSPRPSATEATSTPKTTPSQTPAPLLTPTRTVPPTREPGPTTCLSPDGRFGALIDQARALGIAVECATAPVIESQGAVQVYWRTTGTPELRLRSRSLLIRRDDVREIYAIVGEDPSTYQATARVYDDIWNATMSEVPLACAALSPPEKALMPTDALGKVWCENSLWNVIGWPSEPAMPAVITAQETSNGLLLEITTLPLRSISVIIDLETRRATVLQLP